MNKIKFITALILLLSSCTKVYNEVWIVEKYPIEWDEEIVVKEFSDDTICWRHFDTLKVKTLEKKVRIK